MVTRPRSFFKHFSRFAICAVLIVFCRASVADSMDAPLKQQVEQGIKLIQTGKSKEAYAYFEQLNKQRGGSCEPCLAYMALARMNGGEHSEALKLATRALAAASSPQEKIDALGVRGHILTQMALGGDKKKFAEAEQSYRDGVALGATYFRFRLGELLLFQNKDNEGKKELENFIRAMPNSNDVQLARKWMEDPRRARMPFVPDFSLTTLEGEQITRASLAGKTVLIDFWATWCPPCRESLPELKELAKKYPADKFTIISVSADEDGAKWQEFVRSHGMTWKQYRDADDHVLHAFNVHAFPTYVLIDKDGFIRERISGLNPQQTLASRIREPLKNLMQ